MNANNPPAKRDIFLDLLGQGRVSVVLDARREGVVLPDHLRGQLQLRLDYGLDMPVPIEGLDVTDDGIAATLSFDRQPHSTFIPWTAVYIVAQADGAGVLYPEDIPAEMAPSLGTTTGPQGQLEVTAVTDDDGHQTEARPDRESPAETPRNRLSLVPPDAQDRPEQPAAPAPEAEAAPGTTAGRKGKPRTSKRKRPTLRLVK